MRDTDISNGHEYRKGIDMAMIKDMTERDDYQWTENALAMIEPKRSRWSQVSLSIILVLNPSPQSVSVL